MLKLKCRKIINNLCLQALKNQAQLYKSANVPIYGIGIQSHLKYEELDMTLIKVKIYFAQRT